MIRSTKRYPDESRYEKSGRYAAAENYRGITRTSECPRVAVVLGGGAPGLLHTSVAQALKKRAIAPSLDWT